ncbi:TRAP transporter small permease [Ramlibacter sp.]|uniref:TRAP transporter small permease n=1 Tax=Ramlibacter sp. TaxID=1917967 RepID=UPI001858C545|nr:TRAP transporter small permease [Ramlibacter sp.]MBA2673294.1 TRAP transporter small permease [Ramlibacter sp.]
MQAIEDLPRVMGDDGQFHAQDEEVVLAGTTPEAWVALGFFWLLGVTVFYQFFTRYVLNDSAAWTEEIARYLLIGTVFTGAAIGVAKNNHIQVDFFYRHMPPALGRWMSRLVDVLRIAFFGAAVVLTTQMMIKLGSARMTIIDLPMNIVYGVCLLGFAAMFLRSIWVMRVHLRRGWSVLEYPMTAMEDVDVPAPEPVAAPSTLARSHRKA